MQRSCSWVRGVKMGRVPWWLLVRIAASAGLVTILVTNADLTRIQAVVANPDVFGLLMAAGCFMLGIILSTWRWLIVLSVRGGNSLSLRFVGGAYIIGLFLNFFLPSTVGGDIARAELVQSRVDGRSDAYATVLFDRFIAFNSILVISLVASVLASLWLNWFNFYVGLVWLGFAIASAGFTMLITWNYPLDQADSLEKWPLNMVFRALGQVRLLIRSYMSDLKLVGLILLLAIIGQVAYLVLTVWLLGTALGLEVPFLFYLVAVPICELVALVPISFNGIGLREGAYVFLYAQIGLPPEAALALSVSWTLLLCFFSLIGGLCLLFPQLYDGQQSPRKPVKVTINDARLGETDQRP